MKTDLERFERKYIPEPMSGCWLWTAYTDRDGYGRFRLSTGVEQAHRASYLLHNGQIDPGMVVRHGCDTTCCVNPNHLSAGTQAQNIADRDRRRRNYNKAKTHCVRGHKLSGANLYENPRTGYRQCRSCSSRGERK